MDKGRILVVDDQYGIRILLQEVFAKDGYEAYTAANGQEALAWLRQVHPHVVVLDMKIPGMDGIEILREIRRTYQEIQVIMMTAYGELEMIEQADRMGVAAHFSKPFDIEKMRETVKRLFAESGAAAGSEDEASHHVS